MNEVMRRIVEFDPGQMHGYLGWYTRLECGHLRFVMNKTDNKLPEKINCAQCTLYEAIRGNNSLPTMSNTIDENGGNKRAPS